jgi:preprotein translocase subunit SecE
MQNGKEDFKEFMKNIKAKVRDWASSQQTVSTFKYSVLFLLSALIFAFIFAFFDLYHTDPDSARYMLSALVQSQAAIVAIVVSLTLIAVQLTASAYSPRVIRIFRDNLDMWLLLGLYGGSIFYGLLVLKMIRGEDLSQILLFSIHLETHISYAFFLGFFSIVMLFQYMRNIINLLNPANIIKRLSEGITKDKILKYIKSAKTSEEVETSTVEDPIQPIMDIIHGSIMKYDIDTTRVGLKGVTDHVLKIIDSDGEEKISGHFCKHLERVGKLAVSKTDEESTAEVIENLEVFGKSTAEKRLQGATGQTAAFLYAVGVTAVEKGLAGAAGRAVESLEAVGVAAAEKRLENATPHVALYLGHFGKSTAEKGYNYTTKQTVWSLGTVGKVATEKGLGGATKQVALSLGDIGTAAAKKGLKDVTNQAALYLAELTILSEEIVKEVIQNFKSNLKEQDRDAFQKFKKIYEQEPEKLQAEK